MSAADVTPAFVAKLRKTHEGKQSALREHHPVGSWAWLALDILDLCDAIESAWAERDAYLDEVRMTNENEARIMADLIATREECDKLRAELDRLRSAPVAVEVPGMDDNTDLLPILEEAAKDLDCGRIALNAWIVKYANPIPTSRILKDGKVAVPKTQWTVAQMLANAWERFPLKCGERDALVAEWNALRSGEAEGGKG